MPTIDRDWGNIVLGVRVEDTEYETVGSRLVGTDFVPLSVKNNYTNVLPNAHVNWDFSDEKKLRLSFSTGISRPTYIEARAAATIDPIGQIVAGGNPDLEEETSAGVDVAYEWYFADASIFSATMFYRAIDDVISESNERYDLAPLIGHNVSPFLDMNNLTDETDVRYTGKSWNPHQVEAYGRRYLVGVRYSM